MDQGTHGCWASLWLSYGLDMPKASGSQGLFGALALGNAERKLPGKPKKAQLES